MVESLKPAVIGTNVTMLTISTIAAALRLLAITVLKRPFWWDDAFFYFAFLGGIGRAIDVNIMAGNFIHAKDTPTTPNDNPSAHKNEFASVILYETSLYLCKVSILLLYFRIFRVQTKTRIAIIFTILYATVIWGLITGVNIYIRTPELGKPWYLKYMTHYTSLIQFISKAYGYFMVTLDTLILIIPIPASMRIQATWATKLRILSMFMLGIFAVVAASVSTYLRVSNDFVDDQPWAGGLITICATFELNISMLISCAAAVKMVFRRSSMEQLLPGSFKSSSAKSEESGDLNSKTHPAAAAAARQQQYDPEKSEFWEEREISSLQSKENTSHEKV